mmetsp:Transcript_43199/g.87354  ORF Transcript_43199/g.87354 Transcript_43199/m.87354 type:complete len:102 (-) Transcript_43199:197-502(-)
MQTSSRARGVLFEITKVGVGLEGVVVGGITACVLEAGEYRASWINGPGSPSTTEEKIRDTKSVLRCRVLLLLLLPLPTPLVDPQERWRNPTAPNLKSSWPQ